MFSSWLLNGHMFVMVKTKQEFLFLFNVFISFFRLAVLGKLNSFVKDWIAEISESKVNLPIFVLLFIWLEVDSF